jgi:hypothetical protein
MFIYIDSRYIIKEPGERSRYSDWLRVWRTERSEFKSRGAKIFIFPRRPERLWGPGGSFPELKLPEREADRSAGLRKRGVIHPLPHTPSVVTDMHFHFQSSLSITKACLTHAHSIYAAVHWQPRGFRDETRSYIGAGWRNHHRPKQTHSQV